MSAGRGRRWAAALIVATTSCAASTQGAEQPRVEQQAVVSAAPRPLPEVPADRTEGSFGPDVAVDHADGAGLDDAGQDVAGFDEATWDRLADELHRALGPAYGYSASVAVDGRVVRTITSGRRSPFTLDPVEAHHRFRTASISKVITAIVVVQLVEAGVVDLDDVVGERLADGLGVVPADARVTGITVEQLLSHTSGLPSHQQAFFGNGASPCREVARFVLSRPLASPGSYAYSNANTCVLSILIEQLTGLDYAEVVRRNLLEPLGIEGMRLAGTYDRHPDEAMHPSRPGRAYLEALGAAGGWVATSADIAMILASLHPRSTRWRPLTEHSVERMATPPDGGSARYALGLMVDANGSIGHTGTVENTRAMARLRPDGIAWVVLVNGEHPGSSRDLGAIMERSMERSGITRDR